VESATLKIRHLPRNPNVRAYLAGGGATAALVTAAVILFLGVAAFVGFNGLPFGADDTPDATVSVAAGVPEAAATAAAPTAGAVAASPATPSPAALAEIAAALSPSAFAELFPGLADTPGSGGGGSNGPGPGTTPPGEPVPASGALGNTVGGVENAAGNVGLDLPLGEGTKPLTEPIDQTVNDSLNDVGGVVGNDQLGNQVTGALNETTDGLLGQGGLTDKLLGGGK
jgi:hypothetical protein